MNVSNLVVLIGRLTADPVIRYTQNSEHSIASFTLAVDRKVAKGNSETSADFIRCMAWDKRAEFAEKYMQKGSKMAIQGRIQTGSYKDKDGKTVYTTDVVVESMEFAGAKQESTPQPAPQTDTEGFMDIPDGTDMELPF